MIYYYNETKSQCAPITQHGEEVSCYDDVFQMP